MITTVPVNASLIASPKDSTQSGKSKEKIFSFLNGLPDHNFSDKGIENIAKRFSITKAELRQVISDFKNGAIPGREYSHE